MNRIAARRRTLIAAALCAAGTHGLAPAGAAGFDSLGALSQSQFQVLTEHLGAATHFRPIAPAETLGVLGADVSLALSSTEVDETLFALSGDDMEFDALFTPRLHAQKGLPFRLDIGALAAIVTETDATLVGVELRLGLVEGGVGTPAVSLRAGYSRLQGITELEVDNYVLELAISKGILMLTPYAGVGMVRTEARAPLEDSLEDVSVDQRKAFAGLNLNLGVNVGLEADRTGDHTTYSAKLGVRF